MPMNIRTHPRGAPPDFTLSKPRPNNMITDASWWFMEQLLLLEPGTQNGGQYAHKEGYHDTVNHNNARSGAWNDYSTEAQVDREGNRDVSRGHDWTHPAAQTGDYTSMAKYGDRLEAMFNARDPRLEGWREALGQTDKDATPEGLDFDDWYRRTPSSSHAWHWHLSEHTKWIADFWNKWAMLTGLAGWTLAEWQQSTEDDVDKGTLFAWLDEWHKSRINAKDDNADLVPTRNALRAVAWQYVGGGAPVGKSTLGALTGAHDYSYAVADGLDEVPQEVIDGIEAAAHEGAFAGASAAVDEQAIAQAIMVAFQAAGLDPQAWADAIEAGVRSIFADAGTPDEPAAASAQG